MRVVVRRQAFGAFAEQVARLHEDLAIATGEPGNDARILVARAAEFYAEALDQMRRCNLYEMAARIEVFNQGNVSLQDALDEISHGEQYQFKGTPIKKLVNDMQLFRLAANEALVRRMLQVCECKPTGRMAPPILKPLSEDELKRRDELIHEKYVHRSLTPAEEAELRRLIG